MNFTIKICVFMYNYSNNDLIKSASYLSVFVAFVILLCKSYAYIFTDSQSILASLIDSLLDISSSAINLIAIRVSMLPADDNHRFGHEKFQDLAIFSQSIFFSASGIFILFSGVKSLLFAEAADNLEFGTDIMIICTILTLMLVSYQSYVVYRTKSTIIAVDKLHYFTDLLTNIVVIFSLYYSKNYWYLDSLAGIFIALYIMFGSYKIFKIAIRNLADEEFHDQDKQKILQIVGKFDEARGVHELKTRYAAHKPFIQFHLEMDANLSLRKAHEISEKIEAAILNEFPEAEIIIHQDPDGVEQEVKYREKI